MVKTLPSNAGGVMQSLTGKLKSHMLWGCSQTLKKKESAHLTAFNPDMIKAGISVVLSDEKMEAQRGDLTCQGHRASKWPSWDPIPH